MAWDPGAVSQTTKKEKLVGRTVSAVALRSAVRKGGGPTRLAKRWRNEGEYTFLFSEKILWELFSKLVSRIPYPTLQKLLVQGQYLQKYWVF